MADVPTRQPVEINPPDNPSTWLPAALRGDLFAVPLIYRVMIANTIFLIAGAFLGTLLVVQTREPNRTILIAVFIIIGILLCIVVNLVLMSIAFYPLRRLRDTMRLVQAGDMSLRAPISGYDPDADELAQTFNTMIARVDELSRNRAAQILRAQEEERKRIARELHDETSQSLTSLLMSVAALDKTFPQPEAHEQLQQVRDVVHSTLRSIRNLSLDLRPSALDELGLVAALHGYVKEYQQRSHIEVTLTIQGFRERYSNEIETAIYRIVQEAMTNTAKHSRATTLQITLIEDRGVAHITIKDNGRGFDMAALIRKAEKDRGLGLMGMRERAALVGGVVDIISSLDDGTTIQVTIPLFQREAETHGKFDE